MGKPVQIILGNRIIDATPEAIANLFCSLKSDGQAAFFNCVAEIASTWSGSGFPMQMQYVTEEDGLNYSGRRVMQMIGEYSHWGLSHTNRRPGSEK